jgi:hypothetical protein
VWRLARRNRPGRLLRPLGAGDLAPKDVKLPEGQDVTDFFTNQVSKGGNKMQKWEYCAVAGVARGVQARKLEPAWPSLWEFTTSGIRMNEIKGNEADKVAATIAQLGLEGWEAFGMGSTGEGSSHVIYFKRPIG